jgi:hypothetical protein
VLELGARWIEDFEVVPCIESQLFRGAWEGKGLNGVLPTTVFDNITDYWLAATELEFLELKMTFLHETHARRAVVPVKAKPLPTSPTYTVTSEH